MKPSFAEMAPERMLLNVESQINACMRGEATKITCPYCGEQNKAENAALCCADMGLVVRAVLRKQAQQECLDTAMQIMEAVDKAAMN